MCAHMFSLPLITPRIRRTQLRTPRTKYRRRRLRRIIIFKLLPRRPAEIYTLLPPRHTPKNSDSDIMAYLLSELIHEITTVVRQGCIAISFFLAVEA